MDGRARDVGGKAGYDEIEVVFHSAPAFLWAAA